MPHVSSHAARLLHLRADQLTFGWLAAQKAVSTLALYRAHYRVYDDRHGHQACAQFEQGCGKACNPCMACNVHCHYMRPPAQPPSTAVLLLTSTSSPASAPPCQELLCGGQNTIPEGPHSTALLKALMHIAGQPALEWTLLHECLALHEKPTLAVKKGGDACTALQCSVHMSEVPTDSRAHECK